jgi:hypothetical protein
MARTHKKVRYSPSSKENKHTPATAASSVEQAFKFLEGRWKLVILFHLFGEKMLRFSDLERAPPPETDKRERWLCARSGRSTSIALPRPPQRVHRTQSTVAVAQRY